MAAGAVDASGSLLVNDQTSGHQCGEVVEEINWRAKE